jgi:hypothetical protein
MRIDTGLSKTLRRKIQKAFTLSVKQFDGLLDNSAIFNILKY